jgi:hypothetical protein
MLGSFMSYSNSIRLRFSRIENTTRLKLPANRDDIAVRNGNHTLHSKEIMLLFHVGLFCLWLPGASALLFGDLYFFFGEVRKGGDGGKCPAVAIMSGKHDGGRR